MRSKMGSIIKDFSADHLNDNIILKATFAECHPLR